MFDHIVKIEEEHEQMEPVLEEEHEQMEPVLQTQMGIESIQISSGSAPVAMPMLTSF